MVLGLVTGYSASNSRLQVQSWQQAKTLIICHSVAHIGELFGQLSSKWTSVFPPFPHQHSWNLFCQAQQVHLIFLATSKDILTKCLFQSSNEIWMTSTFNRQVACMQQMPAKRIQFHHLLDTSVTIILSVDRKEASLWPTAFLISKANHLSLIFYISLNTSATLHREIRFLWIITWRRGFTFDYLHIKRYGFISTQMKEKAKGSKKGLQLRIFAMQSH